MGEVTSESVLTPDEPEEDKGVTLEDWMEARDAELMEAYTSPPSKNDKADRTRAQSSQGLRKSQREVKGPYTANLIAESVYGSPGYAGTVPASRQQRRGRNRGIPPKKIAPLSGTKPSTAPAAIFLASPLNKQFQETKKHQSDEEKRLRDEVERQKRDIALLRSQVKHRDEQLELMAEEVRRLKEENSSNQKKDSSDSLSRKSKDTGPLSPNSNGPLSPNSIRLQSLSQPRKVRPKASSDGVAKSYIDWIEYYGSEVPGVGDYDTDASYKKQEARGGGKFNQSNSKSDLDWKIHNAKQTPGPGTYTSRPSSSQIKGGRISVANVKSDIDWQILRASQLPGPGEYKPKTLQSSGGSFSTANPKSDLEWKIYYAQKSPGPGEYKIPDQKKSGGSFSTANPKSELEWKIYYAQKLPGAGEYNTNEPITPSGGKFNQSKPKTDLDWTIYNAQQSPGPGQYKIKDDATRASSHSGKFPFVYKPTDPDKVHLAKGMNAVVKMNRQKKIVMAMMKPSMFGGGKKLSQMSPDEKKKWEEERNADVQRTRDMLDRLAAIQQKRRKSIEMGEVPPVELFSESHIIPREVDATSSPKNKSALMGSLLKKHIKTGEVEKMVDEQATNEATATTNQGVKKPASMRSALSLEIPNDSAQPNTPTDSNPSSTPQENALDQFKPKAEIEMENKVKQAQPIEGYCFEPHEADWVESVSENKLGENGLSHGNVIYSLREPPTLGGASLLLFKLSQKVAADLDKKISGPAHHCNYYLMFKQFDLNHSNDFSRQDFNNTIRHVLGIDHAHTSDKELSVLFDEINTSGDTITLGEFAAFAKGAQHSSSHHGHKQYKLQSSNSSMDKPVELHLSPNLDTVHLVLWRLAVHCAAQMDKNKPADAPHTNPATVTYSTMFSALDIDKTKRISKEEWALVFRKMLGLGLKTVSDEELLLIYDDIHQPHGDSQEDQGVTLSEFAAYAAGARESTFARGAGFVWDISEQDFEEEIEAAFDDLLVLDGE